MKFKVTVTLKSSGGFVAPGIYDTQRIDPDLAAVIVEEADTLRGYVICIDPTDAPEPEAPLSVDLRSDVVDGSEGGEGKKEDSSLPDAGGDSSGEGVASSSSPEPAAAPTTRRKLRK